MSAAGAPLAGRTALVAGGSAGIGRAAALELAARGADVAIVSRDAGRAAATLAELRGLGRRAFHVSADLTAPESVAAIEAAVADFAPIDLLVACGSGFGAPALPFVETPPERFPDYLAGVLMTRLHAIRAVLPAMRERGYGKVVVVTSEGGRTVTPGEALFGAAAAAVIFAVRALARESARAGVRVNAVSVTLTTDTPTHDALTAGTIDGERLAAALAKIEARTPFGLNSPAEIGAVVAFLAEPASDKITGATLPVTAGLAIR
ncbi:MAG: SDR family oxidoreductase [Solirubrobacterales bacterium]